MKQALVIGMMPIMLAGCSSVLEGSSQRVTVNTNPIGAECSLSRDGRIIGRIAATPGTLTVEKTKHDIQLACHKDGYQDVVLTNRSGFAAATFGNVMVGGLPGWGVDSASGADNKYQSPLNITLVPDQVSSH